MLNMKPNVKIYLGDTMDDRIAQAIVATHEPKQASAKYIKKYIAQYHPTLKTEEKPYLFKHALERASQKGTIRLVLVLYCVWFYTV